MDGTCTHAVCVRSWRASKVSVYDHSMSELRSWVVPFLVGALMVGCGSSASKTPDAAVAIDAAKTPDAFVPPIDAFVPPIDAPAGNFACAGMTLPTTAPNPVGLAGRSQTISGTSLVAASGVAINAYKTGNPAVLANATTAADGTFALSIPSGGNAVDGYIKATKATYRDTYLDPPTVIYQNLAGAAVLILQPQTFSLLVGLAGATQSDANGTIGLVILDCDNNPVAGATVAAQVNGADVGMTRYTNGMLPSNTATMTDATGLAFVFDVPPGDVTVSAQVGGQALRSHVVAIHALANTTTAIRP
jgi:hypothetical protein